MHHDNLTDWISTEARAQGLPHELCCEYALGGDEYVGHPDCSYRVVRRDGADGDHGCVCTLNTQHSEESQRMEHDDQGCSYGMWAVMGYAYHFQSGETRASAFNNAAASDYSKP